MFVYRQGRSSERTTDAGVALGKENMRTVGRPSGLKRQLESMRVIGIVSRKKGEKRPERLDAGPEKEASEDGKR